MRRVSLSVTLSPTRHRATTAISRYRWLHSSIAPLHPASQPRKTTLSSPDRPPSSPRRDPSVPVWPLEDLAWSKEQRQNRGLHKWGMPEKALETIVLLAASGTTEDDLILSLLSHAPIPAREAAVRLALSFPKLSGRRHEDSFDFRPPFERLVRIAWNDGGSDRVDHGGVLLSQILAQAPETRGEALWIADKMILIGAAEAYTAKAWWYLKTWMSSRDAEEKATIADQLEQTLLEGMNRRQPQASRLLGDLLWEGSVLERDQARAKACWLQGAEWPDRLWNWSEVSTRLAERFMPRSVHTPWESRSDADAATSLKHNLATALLRSSSCRLGLFYYLRPNMDREEHIRIWTVEPDDMVASEYFTAACKRGNANARRFLAEMLIWNRAVVPEGADVVFGQYPNTAEDVDEMGESDEGADEAPPAVAIHPSAAIRRQTYTKSDEQEATLDPSSERRAQLMLAQRLLPRSPPSRVVGPLLALCARLLTEVEEGGPGLPTASDANLVDPPGWKSSHQQR
ncbi:hypothetical protein CALVIDRAFT_598513 [Calocera viscosa TUFC12733]|uniref:Uncharacterized protein n=1 Tax=Calocera viscosa (strain TUFC12733) TaxID=1330018 RepID=A0A167LZQ4_CALVF|nr:hypothetical protein CALVIDRAFT_598513 [Calocera viscosa TUFC12733]